jgi:NTP pyrophosphatase (non-canonical NTP hydrolase)
LEDLILNRHIDFNRYEEFVSAVTSDASTNFVDFADRIGELDRQGANIERLLTAGVGINAEGGEFLEIIKKMVFQGKPWNEDNREHLIIELGDVMWYVAQATMALDISFDEVIETNVNKLKKRYPGGEFNVHNSEVRAAGDR